MLIAHFSSRDSHHALAEKLLLANLDESLGMHPVSLAEVFVGPARTGVLEAVLGEVADLGIVEWVPTVGEPARLARLRATTGLKIPDCCVLSAAPETGAAIATFDERLATAATERGIEVVRGIAGSI